MHGHVNVKNNGVGTELAMSAFSKDQNKPFLLSAI